jgi:glutaredoxin-related protein
VDSKYILYVSTDCFFCKKAIKLLEEDKQKFSILNLKKRPAVLKELKEIYDWKTVPMVFHRQDNKIEFIGGFTDLSDRLGNV